MLKATQKSTESLLCVAQAARVVTFTGSWFDYPADVGGKVHTELQENSYTAIVTLEDETWALDVATDTTKRTALVSFSPKPHE